MDDGSALILTVANYFTPANKNIPTDGVAATVEVRSSVDELLAQANEKETPMPSASIDDPVMKKALDLLQGNTAATEKKAA